MSVLFNSYVRAQTRMNVHDGWQELLIKRVKLSSTVIEVAIVTAIGLSGASPIQSVIITSGKQNRMSAEHESNLFSARVMIKVIWTTRSPITDLLHKLLFPKMKNS